MELYYKRAESAVRQPEIEVGVTTVYFRRNFQQMEGRTKMEGEDPELIWQYEEAALSKDEAIRALVEQNGDLSGALADDEGINIDHECRLTMLELGLTE